MLRLIFNILFAMALLLIAPMESATAQVCRVPDSVLATLPRTPPTRASYETLSSGTTPFDAVHLGIGHLRHDIGTGDGPPGGGDWLNALELPLSTQPGAPPTIWIARGWIMRSGEPPEPLSPAGMIETTYEEPSFVALGSRADGWVRIRFSAEQGEAGTAWLPTCALANSPARLELVPWSEWLLSDRISPLYVRSPGAADLFVSPSSGAEILTRIAGDHILEPLEIRGEWMRVILKQPSDYCAPEVLPVRREGWIRWFSTELGPLVWYFSRGC